MDRRDIEKVVKDILDNDIETNKMWGILEGVLYKLYESDFLQKRAELLERLINYCQKNYKKAVKVLKKQGINVNKLDINNWYMFFEWCVSAFVDYKDIFKHDPELRDEVIIYGETVIFLYEDGKWKMFENSYKYGEVDRYLYRKIIMQV